MSMYRSSDEIVAYVDECVMICTDCVTPTEAEELYPVFLDNNEADTIQICERCEIPIETTLTSEGIKYFHSRRIWGDSDRIYGHLLNIWYSRQEEKEKKANK